MNFLTPGFFDALVLIVIFVGLVAAAIRLYSDFRRGPRWPDEPIPKDQPDSAGDTDHA
jgi:hypothetical protein